MPKQPLPDPTPETIASTRERGGDTMEEAAERVHVDRTVWWKWEKGKTGMPLAAWELYLLKKGMRQL